MTVDGQLLAQTRGGGEGLNLEVGGINPPCGQRSKRVRNKASLSDV